MKKLNKLFAILVAMAMVLSLGAISAFAAAGDVISSVGEAGANIKVTKALEVPEGTTNPDKQYKVTLTQVKEGDVGYTTGVESTAITDTDGSFGTRYLTANENDVTANSKTTFYGVQDIFATPGDVTALFSNKAGRYQFKVVEDQAKVYSAKNTEYTPDNETFENSKAEYTLFVDVAWTADGSKLYVQNIAVRQDKDDEGDATGTKPDPGEGQDGQGGTTGNGFKFTNSYLKTKATEPDGKDPSETKDDTGLYVQKTVAGYKASDAAEAEALTDADKAAKFTFNVKVDAPAAVLTNQTMKTAYKAKVVDTLAANKDAAINVEVAAPATIDTTAEEGKTPTYEITIPAGQSVKITLKHGQRLVFTDLDVGAKYTVSETEDSAYTTSATATGAKAIAALGTGTSVTNVLVDDDDASLAYTNTRKTSNKPTGILISNLPYIALALVAIGGLVAYVVVRRKADDEA